MTVSDILDGGFAIMKRAPATVIGLTAVFVVPVQALGAWLNRGAEGLDLERGVLAERHLVPAQRLGRRQRRGVGGAPGRAR